MPEQDKQIKYFRILIQTLWLPSSLLYLIANFDLIKCTIFLRIRLLISLVTFLCISGRNLYTNDHFDPSSSNVQSSLSYPPIWASLKCLTSTIQSVSPFHPLPKKSSYQRLGRGWSAFRYHCGLHPVVHWVVDEPTELYSKNLPHSPQSSSRVQKTPPVSSATLEWRPDGKTFWIWGAAPSHLPLHKICSRRSFCTDR